MENNKTDLKEITLKYLKNLYECKDEDLDFWQNKILNEITDRELLVRTVEIPNLYWLPILRRELINFLATYPDIRDFNFNELENFVLMHNSLNECSQETFNNILKNFQIEYKNLKSNVIFEFQPIDKLLVKRFGILKIIYEKCIDEKIIDFLFSDFEKYQDKLAYPAEQGMTIVALNQKGSSPFCWQLKMVMLKLKNFQVTEYDKLRLYKAIMHESYHMYIRSQAVRSYHGENHNVYKFLDEGCAELYGDKVYQNNDFLYLVNNISYLHIKMLGIDAKDVIYNFLSYMPQRSIRSYEIATSFVKFCDKLLADKSITALFVDLHRELTGKSLITDFVEQLGQNNLYDLIGLWVTNVTSQTLTYSDDSEFKCEIEQVTNNEVIFNYSYPEAIYMEQSIFVRVDKTHVPLIMLSENRYNSSGKFKIITDLKGQVEVYMAVRDKVYYVLL